jgi:hypothetical protein
VVNVTASVHKDDAGYQAVIAALAFLKEHEVCIGVPENSSGRKDDKGTPVNNAELLFIHTNGSPIKGIPPRPVLEPAIAQNKERVSEALQKAVDAAIDGNKGAILPALESAGMDGQNIARKFFTDSANGFAPNKPATIERKGSDRPLIDTDEMRSSITYVVRKVKR